MDFYSPGGGIYRCDDTIVFVQPSLEGVGARLLASADEVDFSVFKGRSCKVSCDEVTEADLSHLWELFTSELPNPPPYPWNIHDFVKPGNKTWKICSEDPLSEEAQDKVRSALLFLPRLEDAEDPGHFIKTVRCPSEAAMAVRASATGWAPYVLGATGSLQLVFQNRGRSLYDLLVLGRENWTPEKTRNVLRQCAFALRDLHKDGIVHKDLTMRNVLYDGSRVSICDFECTYVSIFLTPPEFYHMLSEYTTYEDVVGLPWSSSTDVFAFSILMWSLLSRNTPRPFRPLSVEGEYSRVFERCNASSPALRPSMAEVCELLGDVDDTVA